MQQDIKKKSKKKKKKRRNLAAEFVMLFLAVIIIGILVYGNMYCKSHFIKGTIINEIDASGMTKEQLESQMRKYELTVIERNTDGSKITEVITGDEIGVCVKDMSRLDDILQKQNVFKSLIRTIKKDTETVNIPDLYTYQESAMDTQINKLKGLDPQFSIAPENATLSEYDPLNGYSIIPEKEGNLLNRYKTENAIKDAANQLLTEIDLDSMGCYEKPEIYADDPKLSKLLPQLKKYTDVVVTYKFQNNEEVVDGKLIDSWLNVDEENAAVTLDEEKVKDYVAGLRKKYDSIFRERQFMTSYGREITIKGGDYGWWMDYKKEQDYLINLIENGQSEERVPEYFQTAAQYGEKDYGNTYVEVNLTAQHLFVYVDGTKVLESDFVSGNSSRNFDTPEGIYGITYKEMNAMLVGENYETPVTFWMPFNGNIGLHDAVWRDSFGGDIYSKSGSHGCVNLPYNVAKKIYGYVSKGTAVICYRLDGTQSESTTAQSDQEKAQSAIDAIDRIGAVTKDNQKKVDRARQVYNELGSSARQYVTNYKTLTGAEKTLGNGTGQEEEQPLTEDAN